MHLVRRLRRTDDQAGFTLIELVVTMGILSIVLVTLTSTLWQVQRSEAYSRGRTAALDDMRASLERMTKDLRMVSSINGTPSSSSLDVQTYVDGVAAQVEFAVSGQTLTRSVNGGTAKVIQTDLDSTAVFAYTPDVTTPQLVTITLVVKPSNLPDTTLTLDSEVEFRNR